MKKSSYTFHASKYFYDLKYTMYKILLTIRVVWSVHKKRFSPEKFWSPSTKMKCDSLAPLLEEAWETEVQNCKLRNSRYVF